MSNRIPSQVAKTIKLTVFKLADDAHYLTMSQNESNSFINSLVMHPDVGITISNYLKRNRIRSYIINAILKSYISIKKETSMPHDMHSIILQEIGIDVEQSYYDHQISLFRSTNNFQRDEYVVVSSGSYVKWETALRKSLLFIAKKPFSNNANRIYILLLLYLKSPITRSDKMILIEALKRFDAIPYFILHSY